MEQFKRTLQRQQYLFAAGMLAACAAVLLSRRLGIEATVPEHVRDFIDGFQVGIVAAVFGRLFCLIVRNSMALRSPERLQKLHISVTDERLLFIRQKTDSAGMTIVIYGLALATLVAGNVNETAFFALMSATIFAVLARGIAKAYYRNRI